MSGARRHEALTAIDEAVSGFVAHAHGERIRLYRLRLQATVTAISPLARDLATHGGFDLGRIAHLLPVPRLWPPGAVAFRRPGGGRPTGTAATCAPGLMPTVSSQTELRLGPTGAVARGLNDPLGDLGFVPERGVLEVVARIGSTMLHTVGGDGFIVMSEVLPETVLTSAVGRPVEELVSHAAIDARGYSIRSAFIDEFSDGCVVVFRTGLVPFELPWRDELEREISRRRVCVSSVPQPLSEEVLDWHASSDPMAAATPSMMRTVRTARPRRAGE